MKVTSKIKMYEYHVVEQALKKKEELFSSLSYDRLFYFVDQNFYDLYKENLKEFIGDDFCLCIDADERNKEYTKLTEYYKALIDARFTRKDMLVTFGGGVLQDLSGFIASTLYRGIKWTFFPTTLLAQADSCIGSKTSINFGECKNLIGTFYPPDQIFIDAGFTKTLTDEHFNSGLGEMIKFHILSDCDKYAGLIQYLDAGNIRDNQYFDQTVESTLNIKKSYFEQDEFDTGIRNLLNYGHCYGHALESTTNFGVTHGEAVIVGMGFANLVARKRGIMSSSVYDELEAVLQRFYPKFSLGDVSIDSLIRYLKKDKKRIGKDLTVIMGSDIGQFGKYDDVTEEEAREAHAALVSIYPSEGKSL